MSVLSELQSRSGGVCELCGGSEGLIELEVQPVQGRGADDFVFACSTCVSQVQNPDERDSNHWRCLNDAMWNEAAPVKVVAWRMLNDLKSEGWPQDLLDMMYLEEDVLAWAKSGYSEGGDGSIKHIDSNGVQLQPGDNVVLIKDLNVKGSSLVAKRGTAVRGISLDMDNAEYIEGKVNGQQIVILTKFVKKM